MCCCFMTKTLTCWIWRRKSVSQWWKVSEHICNLSISDELIRVCFNKCIVLVVGHKSKILQLYKGLNFSFSLDFARYFKNWIQTLTSGLLFHTNATLTTKCLNKCQNSGLCKIVTMIINSLDVMSSDLIGHFPPEFWLFISFHKYCIRLIRLTIHSPKLHHISQWRTHSPMHVYLGDSRLAIWSNGALLNLPAHVNIQTNFLILEVLFCLFRVNSPVKNYNKSCHVTMNKEVRWSVQPHLHTSYAPWWHCKHVLTVLFTFGAENLPCCHQQRRDQRPESCFYDKYSDQTMSGLLVGLPIKESLYDFWLF